MPVYYNERDPFAAAWLRELIDGSHIAPGSVDTRDIRDVRPSDLKGFDQCHFFAGIGGWSLALQLAGWPADQSVWTGSCPCQSFSTAGQGRGFADERHLWPIWFRLIRECRPPVVFGEQVEAAVRHGWLDLVQADLEGEGYACGAAVLGAHSVGALHIRQRLWFMAHADGTGRPPRREGRASMGQRPAAWSDCGLVELAHANSAERPFNADIGGSGKGGEAALLEQRLGHSSNEFLDNANDMGSKGRRLPKRNGASERSPWEASNLDWLPCRDGKARPTQPGLQPLAHGVPNRAGTLRGAGNAICPQTGAEIIKAFMESLDA
jgi:DNA (cytosine-5)-methyltransferase 1